METARLQRARTGSPPLGRPARVARARERVHELVRTVPWYVHAFVGLVLGLSIAGVVLGAGNAVLLPAQPVRGAVALILAAAALGGVLGMVAASAGRRNRDRSRLAQDLQSVAETIETLSVHDVVAVVDALADIAHGEPVHQLKIEASPVAIPADANLRRLAEAVNTTVARLESSVEQFNLGAIEPCKRLFYVGPDDFLLGSICAEELARHVPPDAELLVLLGRFTHAGMELRRRGFESGLRDRIPGAHIAGVFENRYDRDLTYDFVKSYLATHPNLAGMYSAEGVAVQGAAQAVIEAGKAKEIAIVCHDLVEETLPNILRGVIAGTVTQDAFGQGYDTPVHLFNHLAFGWVPPEQRLSTRMEFVTAQNLSRFWTPEAGLLDSAVPIEARPKPFGRSRRPLRIAMLGIADNPFWRFARAGSNAAAELLVRHGATVDWILADDDSGARGINRRVLEKTVAAGYDAIATPVFELGLVPELNRAVDMGIAVATYNSETASLGGLIAALSRQWRRLEETATRLEASATEDPLTGVGNRRAMAADLAALKRRVESSGLPAGIVMIDIDRFKPFNDTQGHMAGDQVLREVANAIRRAIRPTDRVYRYGGEEFLVALESIGEDAAAAAAQRIVSSVRALELDHPANDPWAIVTVSAGVGMMRPGVELDRAIDRADVSLYAAKADGRNRAAMPPGVPGGGESLAGGENLTGGESAA